jgi:2-dehydropantoate 2-reductase
MTHFGVIGMGPVGTTLSAALSVAGHRVSFLCRDPDRCETLLEKPVRIVGAYKQKVQLKEGHTEMPPFVAGQPDVILICVKSCSSRALLMGLGATRLPAEVVIVSCQNGLDVEEQIAEVFGSDRGIRMVLNMGCSISSPDTVTVAFRMPHYLGCLAGCDPAVGEALVAAFNKGGFDTKYIEDYRSQAYKKAILNASLGSVSALTRMTMSDAMNEPELYRMMAQIVREGIEIGCALGLEIDDDYQEQAMAYLSKGGNHKPSILLDIERCRPTENEYHCGKMFRWSEALNIDAPVTQSTYYLLKNLERSLRRSRLDNS